MQDIQFTERAVAFIDILGFSNLVEDAAHFKGDKLSELNELIALMGALPERFNDELTKDLPDKYKPVCTYISDCWIISLPAEKEENPTWGISALTGRITELAYTLLCKGYILSGGMDIGLLWHTGNNVVGPAYQNAYKLEVSNDYPAVQLSSTAIKTICKSNRINLDSKRFVGYGGCIFVNSLWGNPRRMLNPPCTSDQDLKVFLESIISNNIDALTDRPREKWLWFRDHIFHYK